MTRQEAIRHIRDVIAENNSIKPNFTIFEQEKEALYMAIEALQAKTEGDLISRQWLLDLYGTYIDGDVEEGKALFVPLEVVRQNIKDAPSAEQKTGWIPVKWHEITDEERKREGYPKDWVVYIDCEMPCDEQEILVQTKSGYVRWDVCYEDGEFSLDSGWDWIEDIVAWMPMPEPYKGGEKG